LTTEVIDLNENAIVMGNDICYSFTLSSMYRVRTLISTWNMFASKVSDENLFPSFLPEDIKIKIKIKFRDKELNRIVYKPI